MKFTVFGVPTSAGTHGIGQDKAPMQLRRAGLAGVAPLAWAGAVVLATGLAAHMASLAARVRHPASPGRGLHLAFVATAAGFLAAGAGLAMAATLVMPRDHHAGMALAAAAVAAFAGWLLDALAGHAHKVVPSSRATPQASAPAAGPRPVTGDRRCIVPSALTLPPVR